MVNKNHCVTCGHHERDHDAEFGCARCDVSANHRFISPKEAEETLTVLGSELMSPVFDEVPEHVELQARLFALDMAVKAYDLVTDVMDTPPNIEWIDMAAQRYLDFLIPKRLT